MCIIGDFGVHAQPQVTKSKETTLGKYVNAQEAYEMWKANPATVKILDIRSRAEYVFVGHAPMAYLIPFLVFDQTWDSSRNRYPMTPNPDFMAAAKKLFALQDTILVMCRSGGRSTAAVNAMAEAGFTNVYNIIDGFEGDAENDKESYSYGKRIKNGWKNSGAPWTYDINPDLTYK
ncbi:MAG: sulfurtransferase [Candidatus Latescibacteria bacterium]|nr:sulfurtransferase [Candidatus Latescibacterota bacterium]